MDIIIHTDCQKPDRLLEPAIKEYIKRTSPFCRVSIKRYKNLTKVSFKNNSCRFRIASGTASPDSVGFAGLINSITTGGVSVIEFIISSSVSEDFLAGNDVSDFNLSCFDMSEDMTLTVLCEQIYRSFTILNNITYHK